jgi:hypothetical protein
MYIIFLIRGRGGLVSKKIIEFRFWIFYPFRGTFSQKLKLFTKIGRFSVRNKLRAGDQTIVGHARFIIAAIATTMKPRGAFVAKLAKRDLPSGKIRQFTSALPTLHLNSSFFQSIDHQQRFEGLWGCLFHHTY